MRTATAKVVEFPRKRPGEPGYKWTAAQRRSFLATMARKKAVRLKEEREERRALRVTRRVVLDGKGARRALAEPTEAVSRRLTAAPTGRKGKAGSEERLDAIVYLARAYAAYEHVPDEALLGLLALRTLQGRIK